MEPEVKFQSSGYDFTHLKFLARASAPK